MGQIIGLTGAIGSGKSTLAQQLCEVEPSHARYESGELIAEVADDFNRALSGELAFETTTDSVELVNQALIWFIESIGEKLHHDVTWNQLAITTHSLAMHPELFEKMFVYVDAAKRNPKLLDERITADNKEAYRPLLQWLGGYLVAKVSNTIWYDELFRRIALHDSDKNLVLIGGLRYPSDAAVLRAHGGIVVAVERGTHDADTTDVTERDRTAIAADSTVANNGTLSELQRVAEQLWFDIGAGNIHQNYNAHP
jgi:hypothetical protein